MIAINPVAGEPEAPARRDACQWPAIAPRNLQSIRPGDARRPAVALVAAGIRIAEPSQRVDPFSGSDQSRAIRRGQSSATRHASCGASLTELE